MTERIVKLTDEQVKTLRKMKRISDALKRMLSEMIESIAENIAVQEEQLWEQVFSLAEADERTHECTVRYLEQCIVVRERLDGGKETG